MKPQVCHHFVTISWHHYYALWDVLWIVSFGDCSSLAADETFPHAGRKEKVMVPICTMQRWVTEHDGVRRSNISFSGNTPTTCQAAEKVQYLKGLVEGKVLFHKDGGVQNGAKTGTNHGQNTDYSAEEEELFRSITSEEMWFYLRKCQKLQSDTRMIKPTNMKHDPPLSRKINFTPPVMAACRCEQWQVN